MRRVHPTARAVGRELVAKKLTTELPPPLPPRPPPLPGLFPSSFQAAAAAIDLVAPTLRFPNVGMPKLPLVDKVRGCAHRGSRQ